MKAFAILGAAAAALLATPAFAQSGYADLSYTNTNVGGADADTFTLGGATTLGSHVQLDGRYGNVDGGGADVDTWNIGGHLFQRSGAWLWGGYVAYNQFDVGGDVSDWTIAGELQHYMPQSTVTAAVSYSDSDDVGAEQWLINGEYRHYVANNFSLQGNAGYGTLDGGGTDVDTWDLGAGFEYGLTSVPFAIVGGFQHTGFSDGGPDYNALTIGGRFTWGGSQQDRSQGASLHRNRGIVERLVIGSIGPQ